jgi:tRNA-uridine 2-sulfurtransferase
VGARVAVALSGGVDSAVTAALLLQQGYTVTGITFQQEPGTSEAVTQVRQIAARLGIPHEVLDLSRTFAEKIISPFCRDYAAGRTPNPCVQCNQFIKFGALLEYVLAQGAQYLATGHYARVVPDANGCRLFKGLDDTKDQSYFLYTLGHDQLCHILFPLGRYRKTEVKRLAGELGLTPLVRRESQDICFLPAGGYAAIVARSEKALPGEFVDTSGRVVGQHRGFLYYTVGQRSGLGGNTRYVMRMEPETNRIVVGGKEDLYQDSLRLREPRWITGQPPMDWAGVAARVRYRAPEVAAQARIMDNTAEVHLATPQWALAPGQSLVFYQGEEVLGGGVIQESYHAGQKESTPQPEAHQP